MTPQIAARVLWDQILKNNAEKKYALFVGDFFRDVAMLDLRPKNHLGVQHVHAHRGAIEPCWGCVFGLKLSNLITQHITDKNTEISIKLGLVLNALPRWD